MEKFEPKESRDMGLAIVIFLVVIVGILGTAYYSGKLLTAGFQYAEARRATAECEKWSDEAKVFERWDPRSERGYYITSWQKDQCDTYSVSINAEIIREVAKQ